VNGGEMELVALDPQDAGFNAAKLHGNAMDDCVKEFIELKDGADLLCCPLHRNQNVHASLLENCWAWDTGRMCGSAWHGTASVVL
jgi:hypothetical protein